MKKNWRNNLKMSSLVIILIGILFSFYKINEFNYIKHKEIQGSYISHPENLPNSETAKITSFGFKNIRADTFWLETIQYIGSNVLEAQYKKYLYKIVNLTTDLNPYFLHPYTIGQLLLPDYNERYEKLSNKEKEDHILEAEKLGLKGIENFCNKKKIELIKNEDDLNKIWNDEKYSNPCKSYEPPFYLAYNYYYYKNDPLKSSIYYKIAGANKDSPSGSRILAAIMQGKGGNRQKSIYMFLLLSQSVVDKNNEIDNECLKLGNIVGYIYQNYVNDKKDIDGNVLKDLESFRYKVFGEYDEKKELVFTDSNTCTNYVNKAIREINLYYIEKGNKAYFEKTGKNAKNAKILKDNGYINYLPIDFQQYKDYGIIYIYNDKTKAFDYDVGKY